MDELGGLLVPRLRATRENPSIARKSPTANAMNGVMRVLEPLPNLARTPVLLALSALLALAVLAACGSDDPEPASDTPAPTATSAPTSTPEPTPTATAEPTPTATPEPTPTATAEPTPTPTPEPAPGYPIEVIDLLGRTVVIPDKPAAIVGISPTAVELVYAVGGSVIGRTQSVDYPPEALEAPSVGTAYQPSFEAILALEPDLIVADSTIHVQPALMDALEALDVPVLFAGAASVDEVATGLGLMAGVLNDAGAAAEAIYAIDQARDAAVEALAGLDISAVLLIGDRDRNLYGAKSNGYAGSILAALGIANPADEQPDSGPFPGFTRIAPEAMLAFDPAWIFTVTPAPPPAPRLSGLLGLFPGFTGLQAVAEGRVVELDVQLFVQAPGPRVAEAFAAIVAAVAGE